MLTTKSAAFDKFLLHAVDEALNSLGKSVRQSIYFHIKNKFSINRNEIPENLQEFQEGLEKNLRNRRAIHRKPDYKKLTR
jgi:hypothetical protein